MLKLNSKSGNTDYLFYILLLFFFLKHIVPVTIIRYGSVLQFMYSLILFSAFTLSVIKCKLMGRRKNYNLPASFKNILILFIVVTIITSSHKILDYKSFFNPKVMEGPEHVKREVYLFLFNGIILAILLCRFIDNKKKMDILIYSLIAIGAILSIEGFLNYYGIVSAFTEQFEEDLQRENRLTAMTGYSSGVTGERLMILLVLSMGMILIEKRKKQWLFAAISLMIFIAMILTYTRSAYVGFIFAFFSLVSLSLRRVLLKRNSKKVILFTIFPLITMGMILVLPFGFIEHITTVGRLRINLLGEMGGSLEARLIRWKLISGSIQNNLLIGTGIGTSKEILGTIAEGPFRIYYSSVHNFYISWFTETGIIGAIPLLLLYYYTFKNFFAVRKQALFNMDIKMFIYSNMFIAAFLGATIMYNFNTDYAFDTLFFPFLSISYILRRFISVHKTKHNRALFYQQ